MWDLGSLARFEGDLEAATACCEESVRRWSGLANRMAELHVRKTLADIDLLRGGSTRPQTTTAKRSTSIAASATRGAQASTLKNLGELALRRGELDEASGCFLGAAAVRQEVGDFAGVAECLDGLAGVLRSEGRAVEAVTLASAARSARDRAGLKEAAASSRLLDELRRDRQTELFTLAQAEGAEMSVDEAAAYAQTLVPRSGVDR